jgi:hypothetical protein
MNLKQLILGVSLAVGGTAFGQNMKMYIPDENVMLHVSSCEISQDADGNTSFSPVVVSSVVGEVPGEGDPAGLWYLGRPGGWVGPGGWWSFYICGNSASQCTWTSWTY